MPETPEMQESVGEPGKGSAPADVAGSFALQSERLLAVESLAREVLDALGKATQAAATASQAEESSAAHRIGCLEKKQKSVQTQLDELSRFMIGLAGDHEVFEARTGDQLADMEARRQRLSLLVNTRLPQVAPSESGGSPRKESAGNTVGLLTEIRDEIQTFRTGLSNVDSQLEELSRATICLTGDHEVLEARTGDQIESLEQSRRRLSAAVKALKWPETSGPAECSDVESLVRSMQTQLQEELQQQADSLRAQLMTEFTAKQVVANFPRAAAPTLPTDSEIAEKGNVVHSEPQLEALADRVALKTREQHAMLELKVASAESQVNALEGLLQAFQERSSTSADLKINGLRAEFLREHFDGLRADVDALNQRVNMQAGHDVAGSAAAFSDELEALRGNFQAQQQQEEAMRSTLADLHAQVQQLTADREQLLAATQGEAERTLDMQPSKAHMEGYVVAKVEMHRSKPFVYGEELTPGSCEREISCLRTELSALRAEQSFTAARAEGRYAALEAGLSDTRRIAVSSSAQATRRLDSFEAAATVNRRSLDIVMESKLQRTADMVPSSPSRAEASDGHLQALLLRLSSLEAATHEVKDSNERQGSRLGRSEEWLQSLVAKTSDAERRLQQLEKRLPKSVREVEEPLEEALAQLTTGVLKMAQLLGVASEDMCEKLGWRDACWDLPRMMDHAWLRSRLPKKASVIKVLRQKADAEQLRHLQEQLELAGSLDMSASIGRGAESSFRSCNVRASTEAPDQSHAQFASTWGSPLDLGASGEAAGRAGVGRVTGPRFGIGSAAYPASLDAAAIARNRVRSAGVYRTAASPDAADFSQNGRPIMKPSPPQDEWADVRRNRDEQISMGYKSTSRQPSPASPAATRGGDSPRCRAGNVAPPRDAWGNPGSAGGLSASESTSHG